jgi:hypothetical protein
LLPQKPTRLKLRSLRLDRGQTTIYGDGILINKVVCTYGFKNLYEYRYDVRAFTKRGLRNRVIFVRKSPSKYSTLDQKVINRLNNNEKDGGPGRT